MRVLRYMAIISFIGVSLSGCAGSGAGTSAARGQHPSSFSAKITREVSADYLVYLPEGYGEGNKQWPLVLFLHGMGERGSDLDLVTTHGPPKLAAAGRQFPFILVSPQCPLSVERWDIDVLTALLDKIESTYDVDRSREYVTGLSMGGNGTWRLAIAQPDRFAAIVPVCGWGNPPEVCALGRLPVWAFHGTKDLVVRLESGQKMVDTLKACGGNVRFTVYPEAGHDSWTETYNNPEVYEWMLQQSRPPRDQ
jgi:predicted peptidase